MIRCAVVIGARLAGGPWPGWWSLVAGMALLLGYGARHRWAFCPSFDWERGWFRSADGGSMMTTGHVVSKGKRRFGLGFS